ncbi:MAG TPA: NAD(P)-dependent oxidoreductase [Nocardioides sp.]|uniref:NAD-dependent epimerase/dehydratase family protein n=1 Tax=Nocardioides sp. TaxID=35761 RepID=UPI002E32AA25|nr:NAD(P)-dependent oxidoreductase [Nocardioides sp.]HEX5089484.1 NAD(P)-dependent oxidoreductase [Nocardioides sp.]
MHVYIAGGAGVVGTRLIPQLVGRGHQVTATTTSPAKAAGLEQLGASAVVVDGLDSAAVGEAVARAEPDAVVHQMTSLAGRLDPKHFDRSFALTNRLRTEGLDHLLAAAQASGVPHVVAQSYTGWPNTRSGGWVKDEEDPLDPEPPKAQRESLAAIRYLEEAVQKVDGTVLRYGGFYGDASDPMLPLVRKRQFPLVGGGPGYMSWVHLDDAATATVLALEQQARGVFNIVDDEPAPASEWLPYLAECVGAKPPMRLPVWVARLAAGEVAVSMLTRTRGSSNARAKRVLGWELRWPSWRQGFRHGLAQG